MAVTLVTQDQVQDAAGNLTDVFDITFTYGPNNVPYTVQIPAAGDAVQEAQRAILGLTNTLEQIYGI